MADGCNLYLTENDFDQIIDSQQNQLSLKDSIAPKLLEGNIDKVEQHAIQKATELLKPEHPQHKDYLRQIGEDFGTRYVCEKLGLKASIETPNGKIGIHVPAKHGLDRVPFNHNDKPVVIEAKCWGKDVSTGELKKQLSEGWIKDKLSKMQDITSSQSKGTNPEIARIMKEEGYSRLAVCVNSESHEIRVYEGQTNQETGELIVIEREDLRGHLSNQESMGKLYNIYFPQGGNR